MIDWFLAQRLARYVAGEPDARPPKADLRALATDSAERVIAYTGLTPARELPPAEAIGRAEWIAANLGSMRMLLDPPLSKVGDGLGPARRRCGSARGAVLAAEAGAISASSPGACSASTSSRCSTRETARAAAVRRAEPRARRRRRSTPTPDQLLRWVALHEITHALQFGGVPWLREHLAAMRARAARRARASIRGALLRLPDARRPQARSSTRSARTAWRRWSRRPGAARAARPRAGLHGRARGLRRARDGRRRRRRARRPAAPARRAGAPPARPLRPAAAARAPDRAWTSSCASTSRASASATASSRAAGIEALNRVWSAPEMLPSSEELDAPLTWLERTSVPRRLSA